MNAVRVDSNVLRQLKSRLALRGGQMKDYVTDLIRHSLAAEAEAEEPLSREGVAFLVSVIAKKTGESFEACFDRIVSRAVVVELALRVCPDDTPTQQN